MTRRMLAVNGLNYQVEVRGSGPTLVLLHGFTGAISNWHPLMPALTQAYRVVAVDLIGHGETDEPENPERYAMEQAAADLIAIADMLQINRFHLLGYSMGGRLALYIALRNSERLHSLTLESASPGLASAEERMKRVERDTALAWRIEQEGIEAFVEFWEGITLFESQKRLPDDIRGRLQSQRLRNRPTGLANSLRGMGTGTQPSLWAELETLNIPVHLITGSLDDKFMRINRMMADALPDVRHTVTDGAGHTVHLERTQQFTQAVLGFLDAR